MCAHDIFMHPWSCTENCYCGRWHWVICRCTNMHIWRISLLDDGRWRNRPTWSLRCRQRRRTSVRSQFVCMYMHTYARVCMCIYKLYTEIWLQYVWTYVCMHVSNRIILCFLFRTRMNDFMFWSPLVHVYVVCKLTNIHCLWRTLFPDAIFFFNSYRSLWSSQPHQGRNRRAHQALAGIFVCAYPCLCPYLCVYAHTPAHAITQCAYISRHIYYIL